MKRIAYVLIGLLAYTHANSQISDRDMINYQAVMFDTASRVITNKTIGIKVSLLADSSTGTVVYAETHSKMTNENGLLTIAIGGGMALTGQYDSINWSMGDFFLKTEADLEGGTNYTRTSIQNLTSVPFALHAKSVTERDPTYSNSIAASITSSDTMAWNNKNNSLTTVGGISISGDTIRLVLDTAKHYIGKPHGGGVICWLDETGEHGLILGMVDLSNNRFSNVTTAPIDTTTEWDGARNTTAIINQPGHTGSAAKQCADYINADYGTGIYDDWYLPAVSEWKAIWENFYTVQKALESDGDEETKPISFGAYWSSTEVSFYDIQGFTVNTGNFGSGSTDKNYTYKVRPIRRF